MAIDLTNKVIVITGSSRGIGRALAMKLSKDNAKIVLNYCHSRKKAELLYSDILTYNQNCILVKANVTDPNDVRILCKKTICSFGRVDVLINNAGICSDSLSHQMSIQQWQKIININLTGTFLCCQEFAKKMILQNNGKIINIASLKGLEGSTGQANYASSKAGVIALTKTLAKELGRYNISVNAVCPGFIRTDLNKNNSKKLYKAISQSVLPIEHSLDDLLNFLAFISSDYINGISGQVFHVDSRII